MNEAQINLPPLPARPRDGHKGTFGTVLIVGGCDDAKRQMPGAPALTALAAARSGCGLVRVAAPLSILPSILTIAPCATGVPLMRNGHEMFSSSAAAELLSAEIEHSRCVAVGPGWGVGYERQQLLIWLLGAAQVPIVIDADGLNNLAQMQDFGNDIKGSVVLTPHPGELRRLAQTLSIAGDDDSDDGGVAIAEELARRVGCVVVLKGATSCITDGQQTSAEGMPNPAMATGGTGDVLTGIIASLIAQHWSRAGNDALDLTALARWGVRIHAQAGARWSESHGSGGMLATDLCDLVPGVLNPWRGKDRAGSQ